MHRTLGPISLCLALSLVAACGPAPSPVDGGRVSLDAGSVSGAATADGGPADAGEQDAGTDAGLPFIDAALDCKKEGTAGGLPAGTQLQRYDFEPAVFPDALCNDGSPAVLFFRPAQPGSETRWLIQLQGGGACRSADDCAERWCGVNTFFGATQMSSTLAPTQGTRALGILAARPDNLFSGWNQVLLRYCSSDSWVGDDRDVELQGHHPTTGAPVAFRAHFLGARILEAGLRKLRREGAAPLEFGPAAVVMPDLDDATEVVIAGASAGGSGTIMQLDRIAQGLRTSNTACRAGTCSLAVRGLIDSSFAPAYEALGFAFTDACTQRGLCDYPAFMAGVAASQGWTGIPEESCASWHAQHQPTTAWQCTDASHVIRNHVTTPFFIRMGQRDQLHTGNAIEAKLSRPDAGAIFTRMEFVALVQADLLTLGSLRTTAEEGALTATPGVYGPTCQKHETLESIPDTYDVFINKGGPDLHMFDVFSAWRDGGVQAQVVTTPGDQDFCP